MNNQIEFTTHTKELDIPTRKLWKVREKIDKFNKKCAKYNVPETDWKIITEFETEVTTHGFVKYSKILVEYSKIKIDGWLCIGKISKPKNDLDGYDDDTTPICKIGISLTIQEEINLKNKPIICDDCITKKKNPRRNHLLVFKKDSDIKFCGSTCAKSYFGFSVIKQLEFIEDGENRLFNDDPYYTYFDEDDIIYRLPPPKLIECKLFGNKRGRYTRYCLVSKVIYLHEDGKQFKICGYIESNLEYPFEFIVPYNIYRKQINAGINELVVFSFKTLNFDGVTNQLQWIRRLSVEEYENKINTADYLVA